MKTSGQVMSDALEMLTNFVNIYQGPPLFLCLLGGGTFLTSLPLIPGCSKLYAGAAQQYSDLLQGRTNCKDIPPAVSLEWLEESFPEFTNWEESDPVMDFDSNDPPLNFLLVTAAVTTNRWRRGEDHAWIRWAGQNDLTSPRRSRFDVHISFRKHSEEEYQEATVEQHQAWRLAQELVIATVALGMAHNPGGDLGDLQQLVKNWIPNEYFDQVQGMIGK